MTVEVRRAATFDGNVYYELAGLDADPAWVRHNAAGDLVQYDPAGPEKLWYAFSAPEGASWRSYRSDPCLQQARIVTRTGEIRVPAGTFSPSLLIEYQAGACADAGFADEAFAAGVGILRRTAITIAGPRTIELVSARVNGVTISGPEVSFGVSIDRPVYFVDLMPPVVMPPVDPGRAVPTLIARLTIRNTTSLPLVLEIPSGQMYEVVIRNSSGAEVYRWSAGRAFTLALGTLQLSPGEKHFVVDVRLADRSGQVFPQGRYILEAWLTTTAGKLYSATVPFEIQHVQ